MELAEQRPARIEFRAPIQIEKLFAPQVHRLPDGTELRVEQVCQLGRHFIEIRRWRLEGDAWVSTPDHVRVSLDAAVRAIEEINGIIRRVKEAQQRFEKIRSSPSIRGVREVDELIKFIQKKLKRHDEVGSALTRKIMPALQEQVKVEAGKFLQRYT